MSVAFLMILQLGLNLCMSPRLANTVSLAMVKEISNGRGLAGEFSRQEIKDMLVRRGGKHLVIVKYPPNHDCRWEWVYNDADIDGSPVVWARDMGAQRNAYLLGYYKDRQAWLAEINWDYVQPYINEARL